MRAAAHQALASVLPLIATLALLACGGAPTPPISTAPVAQTSPATTLITPQPTPTFTIILLSDLQPPTPTPPARPTATAPAPTPSATPTDPPFPTPAPTTSPTRIPTPTPTKIAKPSPTPSPSPTLAPTATQSPTPTLTPTSAATQTPATPTTPTPSTTPTPTLLPTTPTPMASETPTLPIASTPTSSPTPTPSTTPAPTLTPSATSTAVPPNCRIKGNISNGNRVYHTPDSPYYARTQIDPAQGERWFCSEREAQAAGWRPPASARTTPSTTCANPININTADVHALETLPGIGETLAQRILDHRATITAFTHIDQLTDIKGIGEKTLAKIRPCISLN